EILKAELQEFGRRIRDARDGIAIFLEQSAPEHVYWVERTGKTERFFALNAAPVDLAPVLRRMLFRENCCCVMTSATLAVGRADLAYFRERTGATEAEPSQLGSPFDFQRQMKMFVVQKMPDPRDAAYQKELERWMAHFFEKTEARGGDPFTEYSLPEAILKLRQGVGRLIRTKSDRGIIVILDNRIVTRPYGRAFMQALPKCPVEII